MAGSKALHATAHSPHLSVTHILPCLSRGLFWIGNARFLGSRKERGCRMVGTREFEGAGRSNSASPILGTTRMGSLEYPFLVNQRRDLRLFHVSAASMVAWPVAPDRYADPYRRSNCFLSLDRPIDRRPGHRFRIGTITLPGRFLPWHGDLLCASDLRSHVSIDLIYCTDHITCCHCFRTGLGL